MKRTAGRPIQGTEKAAHRIALRITEKQRLAYELEAMKAGVPLSQWVKESLDKYIAIQRG